MSLFLVVSRVSVLFFLWLSGLGCAVLWDSSILGYTYNSIGIDAVHTKLPMVNIVFALLCRQLCFIANWKTAAMWLWIVDWLRCFALSVSDRLRRCRWDYVSDNIIFKPRDTDSVQRCQVRQEQSLLFVKVDTCRNSTSGSYAGGMSEPADLCVLYLPLWFEAYSLVPGSNRWRQAAGWKCRRAWRRGVLSRSVVPEGLTQPGESKQGEVVRLERLTAQWLCQPGTRTRRGPQGVVQFPSARVYYWVCAPCRLRTGLCLWSHTDTHRSGRELFMWLGSVILTLSPSWTHPWACPLSDPGSFTGDWILSHRCLDRTAELMLRDWLDHSSLAPAAKTESLSRALCLVPYFEPTYRLIVRVTRRFPPFPIPLS